MKIACADFSFPLLPHGKSLDLIASLGMQGADIGLFEGRSHLHPSREFARPAESGKALGRELAVRGLVCADIFLQCAPDFSTFAVNHPDPKRRRKAADWFRRMLDYAVAAGSRHVTILPGVLFPEVENQATSLQRAADELAWRVAAAAEAGLVLGVEAHVGSLAPTPVRAMALLKAVPGLTLTLDYTHFTRAGISDVRIEPLCAHASHLHLRGARKGRLQAPFHASTIDLPRQLSALTRAGYAGWLGIEYVWIDWEHCNECDILSETILFRDAIRSHFKTSPRRQRRS
ncbi:MAG: sugar phosphate isomerase/epimerase family protein [Terrimicrobiaceae bacterium]